MISDILLIHLHLKLIMHHQLEDSLRNILIDYQKSTRNGKLYLTLWTILNLTLLNISLIKLVTNKIVLFNHRTINDIIFQDIVCSISEDILKAIGNVALGFTMVYSERCINAHFISFLLIGPVRFQLKDYFLGKLFSKLYLEGSNSWKRTIEWPVHVVLRVQMFEDHLVTKGDILTSFLCDYGLELLLLSFSPWSRLFFLSLSFHWIHLIINLEGWSRENFKKWLTIVLNIKRLIGGIVQILVLGIVDLKIKVLICIPKIWKKTYDLEVI